MGCKLGETLSNWGLLTQFLAISSCITEYLIGGPFEKVKYLEKTWPFASEMEPLKLQMNKSWLHLQLHVSQPKNRTAKIAVRLNKKLFPLKCFSGRKFAFRWTPEFYSLFALDHLFLAHLLHKQCCAVILLSFTDLQISGSALVWEGWVYLM